MSRTVRQRPPAGVLIGGAILLAIAVIAILAPMILGPAAADASGPLRQGPSSEFPLGTDAQGRNVLLRTLVAARLSLFMAIAATLIAVVVGSFIGLVVAVAGPRINWWGGRMIELLISWPPIIVALAITAILRPGAFSVTLAIGLAVSPQFARLSQTLAISAVSRDYSITARLLGVPAPLLVVRHVIPAIASPLLVLASSALATSLLSMSGLSFIGLGVQAPQYDWGTMLADALKSIYTNPIELVGPAVMIVSAGLAAGLLGDGLARMNDPRRGSAAGKAALPEAPVHSAPAPATANAVAEIDDLRVRVAATGSELVRGISFTVGAGEVVGLVGESGSGKSVTAMTAAHLMPAGLAWSASRLAVAGHEFQPGSPAPTSLALDIGVVFQDPSSSFNPARRLGPQLIETIRVHEKVSRAEAKRRAIAGLREVRITEPEQRMKQYPHELSGGMRQRAMIASSLLTEPKLLIADEPTTALDVTVQAEVLRILREVNRAHGTAILLISHDIDVVSAMCDRVLVMRQGVIVEELDAASLRARQATHPYTQQLLAASLRERRAREVEDTHA